MEKYFYADHVTKETVLCLPKELGNVYDKHGFAVLRCPSALVDMFSCNDRSKSTPEVNQAMLSVADNVNKYLEEVYLTKAELKQCVKRYVQQWRTLNANADKQRASSTFESLQVSNTRSTFSSRLISEQL
eukprot:m.65473 g.65473  ORF g.65473 m.65473 type:complete len:130 (+) comp11737_c0_seq1:210-599(+)